MGQSSQEGAGGQLGLPAEAERACAAGVSECPGDSEEEEAWSLDAVLRVEEEGS